MSELSAPRGAPDVLPPEAGRRERALRALEDLFRRYGYSRIDTPVFEHTEVFVRSLEGRSDIVTKEMYTFDDKGGRSLTLRPEGTAPVVRAALEHGLDRGALPVKLYYAGPMFRHERPQGGRQRQFTQVGVEALGAETPETDAELIELCAAAVRTAGVEGRLLINSIGHMPGAHAVAGDGDCRQAYLVALRAFLEERGGELCEDCRRKIETNPLRTFDCKVPSDRAVMDSAPLIGGFLCASCRDHFDGVTSALDAAGVVHEVDQRLVRGLDYYMRTTFAVVAEGLGAQNEVGGGGRYDGLAETMGGGRLPGAGFALGVERLLLASGGTGAEEGIDAYVAAASGDLVRHAFALATRLRAAGVATAFDAAGRGLKAQFKSAARMSARKVVVVGEREIEAGAYTVRDMVSGEEAQVGEEDLPAHLRP